MQSLTGVIQILTLYDCSVILNNIPERDLFTEKI